MNEMQAESRETLLRGEDGDRGEIANWLDAIRTHDAGKASGFCRTIAALMAE